MQTRVSLLMRLRDEPENPGAWREFVQSYGPLLFRWCRAWGLQEADAQDVTQNVLVKLVHKLRSFEYDAGRSFRAWLKTVAHHAWRDFVEEQDRGGRAAGDEKIARLLSDAEARADFAKQLETAFDLEMLGEAIERVKLRVAAQTWEAFRLTALEGLSGAEAAQRIPMQVAQVYVARRRVQLMLREELEGGEV